MHQIFGAVSKRSYRLSLLNRPLVEIIYRDIPAVVFRNCSAKFHSLGSRHTQRVAVGPLQRQDMQVSGELIAQAKALLGAAYGAVDSSAVVGCAERRAQLRRKLKSSFTLPWTRRGSLSLPRPSAART
jgi:hypothetical protein